MGKKPKERFIFPFTPMSQSEMPPKRKEAEKILNRVIADLAELFRGIGEIERITLFSSIFIQALLRRRELDDEETEKQNKTE